MFCLSPFCCVCLRNKEELFNLNNIDDDLMKLWDKLLYCMPEIDDINEDIPLFICRECRCDLRVAFTFRKKFAANYPYVDDYIKQLTYVDGLLLAVEDVEVTEHADLCVSLVDFAKRFQHSSSTIKIETSDGESNSVEIQSERNDVFSNGSDTENIPIPFLSKRENQSTELKKENSNDQEKLSSNWEILTENLTKRRKFDDDVSIVTEIIDVQDDDSARNSVDVKDDTSSLEGINEMRAEVSTLLTLQESQNVVIHKEREFTSVDQNNPLEEADKDINSTQSSSMGQGASETYTENGTTPVNTLNLQQSSQDQHLPVICVHIPTSSNKNNEENQKESTSKPQLNAGNEMLNQQAANSVQQTDVTQPDDSVTNALFKSIRNSEKACADDDDDDVSSRPSVATSMYESDVIEDDGIELYLSENSAEYISDNDYSDISTPDNTAHTHHVSHQLSPSESACAEPSSATLVHIKQPVSDVEDNYSNETVLFRDAIQPNTSPAMTSFSFMKAYLECTQGNVTTDMNTGTKNCQTESSHSQQITTNASTNSTDECSQKNQREHLNNNQIISNSTQNKSVSAECNKNVCTSLRKKIPRLMDLNGSVRKNVTSTFEHFTTCNNKTYSFASHAQQVYRLGNSQTSNTTNVQPEMHKDSRNITSTNVQQEMHKDSRDITSDSSNIPARCTSETFNAEYKCTVCDAKFKYQSLLECHVEEKHTRRQQLLPDIIVQDEQLIRNNRLATYRIPHVNKNKSVGTGGDTVDNTQRVASVAEAKDTSQWRSVDENVESVAMKKHEGGVKSSVDVATNTVNLPGIQDKQTSNPVNSTISAQLKRHKSSETKDNQCKNSVLVKIKSQKKHHYSSASCQSKKKHKCTGTTSRNTPVMIDKAIGTIDFTENSTGLYAFTDATEEAMYRIRADENNNRTDQSNRQQVDKVATNKVKPTEKLHKQPDIVHYHQTTEHLPVDKHGPKSCKTHKSQGSSRNVDKSTETGGDLVAESTVVLESVSSVGETESRTNNISGAGVGKESTKCSLCASTFADLNSLREHLIIQHKTYKKFQCTLCEKYFRQRCRLLYHMVNAHAKAQLHVCGVCEKNFSCRATLNRHMRCHYADKPYKCTVCDKAFRYKESVKTHMVLHTGVKAYRCPYCDRTFAFKGNMVQHVQTHTRDKRYRCPLCDKDFCTNTVMKQHMRTHTGERPYKCPKCARAFTVRQTMVQHMSVHSDIKPYPCTMCTARFKQKQHLRRHMFIHTDDKPYKCTVCDKTFRLKTELNKHSAIHDNTKQPYTCDICNIGYSHSDKLYAHNFNVHYKKDINLVTII